MIVEKLLRLLGIGAPRLSDLSPLPPFPVAGGVTDDPNDPRLRRGVDDTVTGQHEVYLVLSAEERAKGFVRPVRTRYRHVARKQEMEGAHGEPFSVDIPCGAVTTMGRALAETYARDPKFYGATYCCRCAMHRPVGEHGEFVWTDDGTKVGT